MIAPHGSRNPERRDLQNVGQHGGAHTGSLPERRWAHPTGLRHSLRAIHLHIGVLRASVGQRRLVRFAGFTAIMFLHPAFLLCNNRRLRRSARSVVRTCGGTSVSEKMFSLGFVISNNYPPKASNMEIRVFSSRSRCLLARSEKCLGRGAGFRSLKSIGLYDAKRCFGSSKVAAAI